MSDYADYAIIEADEAGDAYLDGDVPGEFRPLSDGLEVEQVTVTLASLPIPTQ